MEMKTVNIDFMDALKTSFTWGMKNLPSILGAVILWVLTCWIPYINVGTTIAICSLPLEISRGKIISPIHIFDKKYRQYMGEVFLLIPLVSFGILGGTLFGIIPGIVIGIAWSLCLLLLLGKGMNPAEAMTMSNKYTNGNKWSIFLANLALTLAFGIVGFILALIPFIGWLLAALVGIAASPMMLSLQAYFYKVLVLDREETVIVEIEEAVSVE